MEEDRTRAALDALGPEDRALLELVGMRKMSDGEIAGILGLDGDRVRARREAALEQLGAELGVGSAEAAGALTVLGGGVTAEPDTPVLGRRGLYAGLGGLAIAAGVAIALAVGGGGDAEDARRGTDRPATGEPGGPAQRGDPVPLRPVTGERGRGSARLVETRAGTLRARIAISGLPDPGESRYAVWLYDSVSRARRLVSFPRGTFNADLPLPRGYERFRFLDVSLEPGDGNRNHSGESLLRVPLRSLPVP